MAIEIEFEGESLQKALEKACKFFNTELKFLDYKVISDASREEKEIGEGKVKISASRRLEIDSAKTTEAKDKEDNVVEFLQKVILGMGLDLKLQCKKDDQQLIIDLYGADKNMLLDNRGQLLSSLQFLMNKIFSSNQRFGYKIALDCDGYRKLREKELREIAQKGASIAKRTGREYLLDNMNPYERRLVHITLKSDPLITTLSRGGGFIKRVAIIPCKKGEDKEKKKGLTGCSGAEKI